MSSGTFYPVVSGDDGRWYSPTYFNNAGDFIDFGIPVITPHCSFLRLLNVTIPSGVTITSAYVKFTAQESYSSTTLNVKIYGNDVDNATAPTNYGEADGLVLTTANVSWSSVPAWTDGNTYNTADISSVIQEVIDRGSWSSGNAIQLVFKSDTSDNGTQRRASSIDYVAGAEKAELHVEWQLSEVDLDPFISIDSLSNNIAIDLDNILLASQDSLSSEPSTEIEITSNTFSSANSMSAEVEYEIIVEANFSSINSISNNIEIEISCGILSSVSSMSVSAPEIISISNDVHRVYLFTLTGGADGLDDITIPISSFQCNLNTISSEQAYERIEYFTRIINGYNSIYVYTYSITYGDYTIINYSTYLNVVIPGFDYVDAINSRIHGELVLKIGYVLDGELIMSEIIATVLFEKINIFEGAVNKSIALEGHGIESASTSQNIILSDITYKNINDGSVTYRCSPDLYLRPGDTAVGTVNISDIVWLLPFTGGITEIIVGDTITGEDSLASGCVSGVRVTSGAWWSHNAVGVLTLNSLSGAFQAENIKVGEDVKAATTGVTTKTYSPGEDSFVVDSVTYSVSADQELYEVSE